MARKKNTRWMPADDIAGSLETLGFEILSKPPVASLFSARYVVRQWRHEPLYCGGSYCRKEALIVSDSAKDEIFIAENEGPFRIAVEAKHQDVSGSVDEKLPYIVESFKRVIPVRNLIVFFSGKFWLTPRGQGAVEWLEGEGETLAKIDKRLIVLRGADEFYRLMRRAFSKG